MGTVLGAFVGGLATRLTSKENEESSRQRETEAVSLCADDLELTPAQKEALRRFLVLLVVKLGVSSGGVPESDAAPLSLDELQRLAAAAGLFKL